MPTAFKGRWCARGQGKGCRKTALLLLPFDQAELSELLDQVRLGWDSGVDVVDQEPNLIAGIVDRDNQRITFRVASDYQVPFSLSLALYAVPDFPVLIH